MGPAGDLRDGAVAIAGRDIVDVGPYGSGVRAGKPLAEELVTRAGLHQFSLLARRDADEALGA
jgi:hypothetical protein